MQLALRAGGEGGPLHAHVGGAALQGQGQLDMAFDYFRKCPLDDQVMDNLYNLALDFERKRQFNKAESVLRYMAEHNPKFRDLEQRLTRAKAMSEATWDFSTKLPHSVAETGQPYSLILRALNLSL